jgi:hypothetical protein
MMIVGVSSKVVPTLSGVDLRESSSLWPVFIFLNVGNFLRVVTEIATDFTPAAYPLMGITGFFEVYALALWSYEMVKNIRTGVRLERESIPDHMKEDKPLVLTPQSKVADVLQRYPSALDTFLEHGFTPLKNPVLRRTMARVVTLEQACRREGVRLDVLLGDLRKITAEK